VRTAAAALLVAGAILGAACGKPAACPTPPAVAVPERGPAPNVVLDCKGDETECGKAKVIAALVQETVGSNDFDCLVTHFDQNAAIGQAGTERSIDLCGGETPLPQLSPSPIGYRESRCSENDERGSSMPMTRGYGPMTNEDIYRVFRASPYDCEGKSLGVMHLNVSFGTTLALGVTDPEPWGVTKTKEGWYRNAKNSQVAGHWIHEHTHRLGFCDRGDEAYSSIIVSYVYGFAGCLVAGRIEEKRTKPLSAYRAACASELGPAFKE
jgi:hypothetical protein